MLGDIFLCLFCDASHYDYNFFLLYIYISLYVWHCSTLLVHHGLYGYTHIQYKYITKYVLAHTHTIHLSLI